MKIILGLNTIELISEKAQPIPSVNIGDMPILEKISVDDGVIGEYIRQKNQLNRVIE